MSMSQSVTEFSVVLPPYFPPPTSSSVRVGGVVVVVGSYGGTDSGSKASPPSWQSYSVFPFSLYVMNECWMKSIRPALCWKCTYQSFQRATTTTTRVRHTGTAPAAHPLEFEVSRCRHPNLLGFSCRLRFECGMTFPTQCLTPERWMGSRSSQPLIASLSYYYYNYYYYYKRSAVQGWERVIYTDYTLSVRKPPPKNTNIKTQRWEKERK